MVFAETTLIIIREPFTLRSESLWRVDSILYAVGSKQIILYLVQSLDEPLFLNIISKCPRTMSAETKKYMYMYMAIGTGALRSCVIPNNNNNGSAAVASQYHTSSFRSIRIAKNRGGYADVLGLASRPIVLCSPWSSKGEVVSPS